MSIKFKAYRVAIGCLELLNDCRVFSQKVLDERGRLISAAEPDDFRGCAAQRSDVRKIRVECDEDKAFAASKFPYGFIARLGEPDVTCSLPGNVKASDRQRRQLRFWSKRSFTRAR